MSEERRKNRGPILSRIDEARARRSSRRDRSSEFPTIEAQVDLYVRQTGRQPTEEAIAWSKRNNLPLNEAPSYLYNPPEEA